MVVRRIVFLLLSFLQMTGLCWATEPAQQSNLPSKPGSDVEQVRHQAYQAFLEGRFSDAENDFRYLEVMGSAVDHPDENLAIIYRDRGDNDKALAHWLRASLDPNADGFIFNQRGWAYLSAGQLREAKESFLEAVKNSSSTAEQAESYWGLGIESLLNSRPKEALTHLSNSLARGQNLLPITYYEVGKAESKIGNTEAALTAFNRSLRLDAFSFEAMTDLAELDWKIGQNKDAWTLYHHLKSLDQGSFRFEKILKKIEKYIPENPRDVIPERRISRPFLVENPNDVVNLSSPTIRVALFTGEDKKPKTMTRVYFMTNRAFRIVSASGEIIREHILPYNQWQISFRAENSLVEVRDTEDNIEYATKEPFRIIPSSGATGSVLLKSARFPNTIGFDPGDRELRGSIEVIPNPDGFKLVNETGVEDYLYGVVGRALGGQEPEEAYSAEAVIARTTALWYKSQGRPNLERSDICDSSACQSYRGVSSEMSRATEGVRKTDGFVLSFQGHVAQVAWHANCGGFTENGRDYNPSLSALTSVSDAPTSLDRPSTPVNLERWLHEVAPESLFSNAAGLRQTHSRWVRIIPADSIRERVDRVRDIGKVEALRVLKRTSTGRILALKVIGAKRNWTATGFSQIQDILSPGSLRSSLFTIMPIKEGRWPSFFILWGAGTGSGLGLCMDGTLGQASLGIHWKDILSRYFPNYQIERAYGFSVGKNPKTKTSPHSKSDRRHLNPHYRAKKKIKKSVSLPAQ